MQQFFELTFPEHLEYAILLFGLGIGLGVHFFVPCPLKKAASLVTVENSHQISVGDGINIIPFEVEAKELVWHGMQLHYIPSSGMLSVMIRFCLVHKCGEIRHLLSIHGLITDDNDTDFDACQLHLDTLICD